MSILILTKATSFTAGFSIRRSLREQVWSGLGSWWVTAFVVLLSAIEAFIVIALALFDLSFIQGRYIDKYI